MKMVLRWFPFGDDSVSLWQIKQIPGISGVATCLPQVPVGEIWPLDTLKSLKKEINEAGLEMEVIESVNIHEDIKKGLPARDQYIDAYIKTIHNLAHVGVRCLCYNFMPVMDWLRSDVASKASDGSYVMAYRHEEILKMDPTSIAGAMAGKSYNFSMPGWEPERLDVMAEDILFYQGVSCEQYWENIAYFLEAVIPHAKECGIKMGVHPDDPPWPLFGLPKLMTNAAGIRKFMSLTDSEYSGLTLCTGSLGANTENNIPALIREFAGRGRVPFVHLRNVSHLSPVDFNESAHPSQYGDLDMFEIVEALVDCGFDGYIRSDHGRMIWGEKARPGYGLYDRALGSTYILGLWEAVQKGKAVSVR